MARVGIQYRKEQGEHGSWIIEESGWCLAADAREIERDCTKRFKLVAIPNAEGCIMKVLDGTRPRVVRVRPSTYTLDYYCVKIYGEVEPLAPPHSGGWVGGQVALSYRIRYQQVGGIS